MVIAVLGLILIQFYWIANMISVEEEKFEKNVGDAMELVVEKIEDLEVANEVVEVLKPTKNKHIIVFDTTATGTYTFKTNTYKKGFDGLQYTTEEEFLIRGNDSITNYSVYISSDSTATGTVARVAKFGYGGNEFVELVNDESVKNKNREAIWVHKDKLVDRVVKQIFEKNKTKLVVERLNPIALDSIINEALQSKGIYADYDFAIEIKGKDSLVYNTSSIPSMKFIESGYKTKLFPDEQFNDPNFLVVNFPDQKRYILESVGILLLISIVFIIIIIAVFYKTVRLLIKQKKITEVKNDLINNITHEFKTPISTISLACEALNEPRLAKDAGTIKRYSSMIKEENSRLSLMVENLLNTAAIEKGDYNLTKSNVDINDLILTITDSVKTTLNELSGRINLKLSDEKCELNADAFHLKNIISNLIDNAIKYSDRSPEITVETIPSANEIVIKISDNGIGIESKYRKKIFDTFYRVPTGNIHNVKGHGIGLSYVKKMVEAHGGNISVEGRITNTEKNKGTTFTIFLPKNGK